MAPSRLPVAAADGIDTLLDRSVALGFSRIGPAVRRHLPTWPADPPPDALRGQTVVVTGATSGLGLATALGVLALGARLVLVARNEEKAAGVRTDLPPRTPVPGSRWCWPTSPTSTTYAASATSWPASGRLDVLVHNAGVMPPERPESPQGHELTMAVHVLGPVLMTDLLRPRAGRRRARPPGHLGRDVRPEAAGRRPGVPHRGLLPHHGLRPQQARPGRAAARCCSERWAPTASVVWATHPGWARHPGRGGVAADLPQAHRAGPARRRRRCGHDGVARGGPAATPDRDPAARPARAARPTSVPAPCPAPPRSLACGAG